MYMCPHVSVTLVNFVHGGDSLYYLHFALHNYVLVTIVTSIFCSVGAYCDENDLRDVAFMKPNETPAVHCTGISRNAK